MASSRASARGKATDKQVALAYARTGSVWMAGRELGMCGQSVHERLTRMGVPRLGVRKWTDAELEQVRQAYDVTFGADIGLGELSRRLGRRKSSVCRKAAELGLTSLSRPKRPRKPAIQRLSREEVAKRTSARIRALWATRGHPRGMLGKRHSPDTLKAIGEKSRAAWKDKTSGLWSQVAREKRARAASERMVRRLKTGDANVYSRCARGRRDDLGGVFFRSAWEANYARFLRLRLQRGEIEKWEYEPHTFWFEKIKRGVRSYTPDFRVTLAGGVVEWHEVKGWMDPRSKTKLNRMRIYYPDEKLIVIDGSWFRDAKKSGLVGLIENWE